MSVSIYYNDIDLFSGIGPVPIVSRSVSNVYVNKKSHLVDSFSLSGRIKRTNCVSGFDDPYTISRTLCQRLSKNFKKFEIIENSSSVFRYDYAIVRNISFSSDVWYDWIPYTIDIECYRKETFDTYGIIDPVEQFELTVNPDNTLQITVSVSCKGLNNSSSAIENAKNFITSFSSYDPNSMDFYWASTDSGSKSFFLRSEEESVNRLTGELSYRRVYIGQEIPSAGQFGVITYSRDLSKTENGEVLVTISGIETCSNIGDNTISAIENDIKEKDWYSIANELYKQIEPTGNLFSNSTRFSLQREVSSNSINFSLTFSNQQENDVYVIDQTEITHDYERSINCITASLTIRSNNACHQTRWNNVLNYYNNLDFVQYIEDRWAEYGETSRLSLKEKRKSISENRYEGVISISATLCDDSGESCGCLENLSYEFSFVPPLVQHSVSPTMGGKGCYYIENLRAANRGQFSIRGSTSVSICCSIAQASFQLKNRINQIMNSYFAGSDKTLDASQISKTDPNGKISFDFTWSADQNSVIPSNLL